tara:strand:- start:27796 stop:30450 length:2655 start_codon:yes stop_codon:yes gene_type:complete
MIDIETICESIEQQPNLQVITANASIARELKTRLLNRSDRDSGYLARITDIDTWTENRAIECLAESPLSMANYQQMLQLWEQVIEQDTRDFPDLQASVLAPQAHRAWLHMLRWQVDQGELGELEEYNDLKLGSWCKSFEERLKTLGLSQSDLVLTQLLASEDAQNEALLYISSGDSLAPLQQYYFEAAFKQVQHEIWRDQDSVAKNSSSQAQFANQELELQAAANWAKSIALANNNGSKIAIICTDSSVETSAVRRLSSYLSSTFSPTTELRICFPRRASDSGILDSALRLLELNRERLTRADCRALIRSPFWGNYPTDIEQRSLWETKLCSLEQKYLQPRDLLNTARTTATNLGLDRQDTLVQCLAEAQKHAAENDSEQSLQYWAEQFSQQLSALGWPGQRPMGPAQSNLVELWNDLLTELVSLGAIMEKISCSGALRLLRRLVQAASIRADKPAVGINMLNTIESAVGYAHIWLLGADSDHWPSMVRPDPLIPIQLQIQYLMPRCRPEQERDFCLNLFEQLRGNCRQLVFSIAQNDTDSIVEFSPLLTSYPELNPESYASELSSTDNKIEDTGHQWHWIDCSSGPALEITDEITKGGSSLFNLMAASPFNAFVTLRLNAKPLPEAYLGIGPHHRGNILHGCLDQIWANLENSETLANTSEQELSSLVDKITTEELLAWQSKNFNLDLSYFEQLKHSFCAVLVQWLNFERSRTAFAVEAREQELHARVGDLNLRLRIDRIDQLEEGSKLLIDYKSGASASDRDLLSSPPTAAQLPLYAISLNTPLAGLAFAIVVSGNTLLKGISSDSGIRSLKPIEDWTAQMDQWKQDLTALALAYGSGDSRVFETQSNFARRDELVGLHRMPEYQDLEDWKDGRDGHDSLST